MIGILRRSHLAGVTLALGVLCLPAWGEQARRAASIAAELEHGELEGIAVTSRGRLFLAPRVVPWGKALESAFPSHVFAAAATAAGDVFLATGPDGQVVKVDGRGVASIFFRVNEPLATAIAALPSGEILAASAPGGKVYKIRPDGTGSVWCETDERYVWALHAEPDGTVLAATGDRGRLLRIDRNGHASVLFDGDESHLVSLVPAPTGGYWAGGAGRGLLYHIDTEGHGRVLYDDDLPEAKALLLMPDGSLVAAFDAPPASDKRPPALRLRVAGGGATAGDSMSDLDVRQQPAIQGVIEGLPADAADETLPLRGKIVRVSPEGAAEELWRSRTEAPFALALDDAGALFATGEPAKLWRIEGEDEITLLATLKEAQVTAFARSSRTLLASTSNPAATYVVESRPADTGTYLAPSLDAESTARWGRLSWRTTGSGGRVELFTRTGNCEDPDGTWSAWSAAQVRPEGSPITSPEGRFLQWRLKITGTSAGAGPSITSVAAYYATKNRPPSIRDVRVDPASAAVSGKATFRWSTADPDGDGVSVDAQARLAGTGEWRSAARSEPPPSKPSDPSLGNDGSAKEGKATWDTIEWDEGVYEMRAVASDQSSNPPAEGLEATAELPNTVIVDRTAPDIDAERKGDALDVSVEDELSGVARLELVTDGKVVFTPRPEDGVCDDRLESFRIPAERIQGDAWSLRATDTAGNAFEAPVPAP